MSDRLYIDVDGVINIQAVHKSWGEYITPRSMRAQGFQINWVEELSAELNQLDVEVVWLTTWEVDAARDIGMPMGFGQNARYLVRNGSYQSKHEWWKARALTYDLTVNPVDRYVWIDDEHVIESETMRSLVISPNPRFGITKDHIDHINRFLAKPVTPGKARPPRQISRVW